ncbi:MAG: PqiC family protein [Candidatus Thiodiazotropha sp.]
MKPSQHIHGLALSLLVILLAGCASPSQPTRFYRMDNAVPGVQSQDLLPESKRLMIGVDQVSVAAYLDRPQIVQRLTEHRLKLHEFDQWAGSFQDNLRVTLGESLQQALPDRQVITAPWPGNLQPDYRLSLMIQQFDWVEDRIIVRGTWSVIRETTRNLVILQRVSFEEPLQGSDIDAVVSAAKRSVDRWARMAAQRIQGEIAPL